MKRSARMEKFAELNAGIENNAGAELATVQGLFEKQHSQLEKLKAYRLEYQQQLSQKLPHAHSANVIHDYHNFISSLNHAITQQTELVRQCEKKVAASRANWLQKKQDVTKMTRAAENLRQKEHIVARRLEQYETDEMTLNKIARRQQTDSF